LACVCVRHAFACGCLCVWTLCCLSLLIVSTRRRKCARDFCQLMQVLQAVWVV
jgi:hypothetical protein